MSLQAYVVARSTWITHGHTWHHPNVQLFGIVKQGLAPFVEPGYQSDMPAFDGVLSDDQIAAVLALHQEHVTARYPRAASALSAQAEQQ